MKVSIIIPFYNVEDYIERSLKSALNQLYSDIEVILVNDFSTDQSLEKVEKIVASSSRISCVKIVQHAQNKGVAAARNSGIDNSTGDYIYFLDSDDELPISAIADLVAAAGEDKPDIVIGDYEVIGKNKSDYISVKVNCRDIEGKGAVLNSFLSRQWNDGTANKLESRKMIIDYRIRFYEGIVHEDILWSFEIALYAHSLKYCHKVTYYYHIRSGSITQSISDRNFSSLVIVMERMVNLALDKCLYQTQPELLNYFANLRIYLLKQMVECNMPTVYIKTKIDDVNNLFSSKYFRLSSSLYSFGSNVKVFLYHLPIPLTISLVRLFFYISKR